MGSWIAAALLVAAACAQAQTYPTRAVRVVVPQAQGGTSEIIARTVAAKLSENLGQQFIVENKGGGGGVVGMMEVARAEPNGYTLILGHVGLLAMNPAMIKDLTYDPDRDYTPVSLLAIVPTILVVHPSMPANDLAAFVALAKAKPGEYYYGSAGNGSAGHLSFEYLKAVTGVEIVHVPYKGTGPMINDLVAGRVNTTQAGSSSILPHIKSGKLRAIAVGSAQRIASLPDVPTVAEQGYPGFETSQWYGFLAPAKTPAAIVAKLAAEIGKAIGSADLQARLRADDAIAVGSTPAEFAAFIKKEQARWGQVVRQSGIKAAE
jgi:tripartite-type tricarboxylate transporter receptor subunit TctC